MASTNFATCIIRQPIFFGAGRWLRCALFGRACYATEPIILMFCAFFIDVSFIHGKSLKPSSLGKSCSRQPMWPVSRFNGLSY